MNAKDKHGYTALINAAMFATPNIVKLLIDSGADVHTKNVLGDTALIAAADNNLNPEVIKILVAAGADVNVHLGDLIDFCSNVA